jgi:hypothetical protein
MTGRWKKRLEKMGQANSEARERDTKSLTPSRVARVIEGLLSHPLAPPEPRDEHPVSLSRRMKRRRV